MTAAQPVPSLSRRRTDELYAEQQQVIFKQTDRMFAVLMVVQWIFGIGVACWLSPRTWAGTVSTIHPHIFAAVFLGGAISAFPILLALTRPGRPTTRYAIAGGQMCT